MIAESREPRTMTLAFCKYQRYVQIYKRLFGYIPLWNCASTDLLTLPNSFLTARGERPSFECVAFSIWRHPVKTVNGNRQTCKSNAHDNIAWEEAFKGKRNFLFDWWSRSQSKHWQDDLQGIIYVIFWSCLQTVKQALQVFLNMN